MTLAICQKLVAWEYAVLKHICVLSKPKFLDRQQDTEHATFHLVLSPKEGTLSGLKGNRPKAMRLTMVGDASGYFGFCISLLFSLMAACNAD